jgi:leucyl aminopeptidase
MAGAAAVLGAMRAIALSKARVNVVAVVPCAENMPSGKAYRPGDVIRFMNGKTAEIISTDAEGRMVLADALTYAVRNLQSPRVVDVATLTGACVIALGNVATGAFDNNPEWMAELRKAADSAGEKVWEMPLFEDYKPLLKSEIADMKNSGGPKGGAITGAMFLKEFVDDTPWVHLDIAGTASLDTPPAHLVKGATGVMVRTLVHLVESLHPADPSE